MIKIYKNEAAQHKVLDSYNQLLKMWSTDFDEIDIVTKYGKTHCIIAGNQMNPPLILLHGVGDNSAVMWALNMKELSKHFYCIAVDTIGGPGKSVPNDHYNKKTFDQVDWLNQVMDHLELETVHIAGVSNGAYMAYNYATFHHERITKVVCMEGGMLTNPLKAMIQTLLIMFPEILIPTEKNLLKVMKKLSSPQSDFLDKHPLIAQHLVHLMKSHNQQAMFVHKLEKYDPAKGAAIKDKLYFLIAEHQLNMKKDLMNVLNDGAYLYKVIPNAGHGINHEQPDVVNAEIIHFLLK